MATPLHATYSYAVAATADVDIMTDFDRILTEVPKEHFLAASKMRDLLKKYTADELALILADFNELRELTFKDAEKARDYIVTAGGPGNGKSTVLESVIAGKDYPEILIPKHLKRAYVDPDKSCLLHMRNTYLADRESGKRSPQEAYEHWREASNFLSSVFLAIALKDGYAIAHGSTMATPFAKIVLQAIKNVYGYKTTVIHVNCPEEVRTASETKRREGGIYQCTDADFVEKQKVFLKLIGDYSSAADSVVFCLRDRLDHVTWAGSSSNNNIDVMLDAEAFEAIRVMHGTETWDKVFQ